MAEGRADLISMADIARLAGQSRATVGNWKARNPDGFPAERGRGARGPLYDRAEVTAWLEATNRLGTRPSEEAVLWDVADRFRGDLATGDVLPLVLILLALMSSAPHAWGRLQRTIPSELEPVLREAVREHLPDARAVLPSQPLPAHPTAHAIGTLSRLDRAHVATVADTALEQAAKALGGRGGEFLAPPSIRKLVIALAGPTGTVYNPATGAGQLMVDAATRSAAQSVELVGQEIDPKIWAISQLNLALHNIRADVALGDVFTNDRHPQLRADRVISVPPWNPRFPAADELRDDPRWMWGEPGPGDNNAAWIQHCLAHLADPGRAVIVLPDSALSEGGRGGRVRQRIVKTGLLDAVISLPAGLFAWTAMPCAIVVFRKGRTEVGGKPSPTLMVDLTGTGSVSERAQSLSDPVIKHVGRLYEQWVRGEYPDNEGAAVATYDELAANDFVIDPGRYLSLPTVSVDREAAVQHRRQLVDMLGSLSNAAAAAEEELRTGGTAPRTTFGEVRLNDLVPTEVAIARGFPTQRALPEGDVRVMSIAALRGGVSPKHFADREALADLGLDLAEPGDVLVAVEGGTIGEVMVVPDDIDPFVPSQQAATLRVVDDNRLDPWYLGAWLSTELMTMQLQRLARGAGIQRIAMKDLPSLVLSVPPLQAQHEIGEWFRAIDKSTRVHRAITACLEELQEVELALTFADVTDGDGNQPGGKSRS